MLVSATALAVPAVIIGGSAAVAVPRHTVTPGKSCGPGNPPATTTDVGQPYVCSYSIQDTDGFHDGMTVSDIDDVVESAGGAVHSGNILGSLQLIFDPGVANPSAMASCTGGSGLGTTASPYVGATLCTIPWDAGIETENYSFYTVAPDDYNLPNHELTDTVTFTWDSLCSAPGGSGISCPPPNQSATIGGSTIVQQLPSDTSTQVLNSSGTAVTTVAVGTTVHDSVTVSPDASAPAGSPTPTGSVTIDWFSNSACSGSPTAASSPLALNGSGQVDATGFSFTPGTAGKYAFQATYNGDPSNPAYVGSTGPCEPLTVVDADIIIAPPTATNPVGATHTLTVTVDENPGTGFVAAPDGTMPTLSLSNTGGATATITGGTCATTGTVSGSCTFTISSPTTGVTQATASVTVIVGGVTLTRTTDGPDSSGDSAPADKTWVQANSSVVTTIQQGGQTVTSVSADSSVTDQATVSGVAGGAAPTGTVTFTFFTNGTCTGTGMGAGTTSLTGGVATSDAEGPLAGGSDSFQATYNGDANYLTSTGKCEPLTVVTPVLTIKKTADATPVSTGTTIGFSITVGNSSSTTATATSVTLNDPLPAGTGIDWTISPAYSGPGTCSIAGAVGSQVLGCSFGDMAPGASASVHISSATTGGSAGTYKNTATASATNASSVMASATIVVQAPGLSIKKTADATPVSVGTAIGFTVTVANSSAAGTGTATSVTLNDPLPAGTGIDWSISPAYSGPGTCSITGAVGSQVLGCTFGNLAPGASAPVHISSATTVASAGTYKNTATASATNAPSVMASATIVVEAPDLSITKTADATPVSVGTTIGFTVTVANSSAAGTATATGVTLNDPLPAGPGIDWSISPAYSGPGTCSITGAVGSQVLGCTFGNLAPGASAPVHISSATTVASAGTYKNTATASATNAPSIMASATIVVTAIPSTSLTETASAKVIANGTAVTFTYLEKNTGRIGISGVTVTGSLCGPATFVSSSDPSKTILDPGATWTFTCTITLTNSTTKIMKFVDKATATGTSVVSRDPAPTERAKATVKVKPGPPPCGIAVTVSPNPLVETGDSDVLAVVQVEACPSFAGDTVNIDSSQLVDSCATVSFGTLQPGVHPLANSIQVVLDDDGNATVTLTGTDCTPGPSLVEADLVDAPYLTATTTLSVLPPNVTPSGVVGYPANEVETGDTTASGFSDVYAVFYVETDPVYAETTAEISSAQLASRCLGGVTWTSNQGASTGSTATATIDNDGNAVFTFTGASCAPGTSTVIADILAGAHTTYSSNYTVDPPTVTPS